MKTPKKRKVEDASKAKAIADTAAEIAKWAATALVAAEQLGLRDRRLEYFFLIPEQREALVLVPGIPESVKTRLVQGDSLFTSAEVGGMMMAAAEEFLEAEDERCMDLLIVAQHLIERLQVGIIDSTSPEIEEKSNGPKTKTLSGKVFQFKITLLGIEPPIWRRIQIKDCTLDKLHEHIQTAMGWTNSHLHQFEIEGVRYGDPELLDDGWEDLSPVNSRRTVLHKIVPKNGKRFSFKYEYDFGDGWEHEILFEGFPPTKKGIRYPVCVEGERACPPEDVGGKHGYQEYVRAMANPEHKRHKEFLEWSGPFDPEAFDPRAATQEMREGLPDWRNE